MKYIIHRGRRRPRFWWLRWPLYFGKKVIEREFLFDLSCIYELPVEDQPDRNKLFGISYTRDPHKESARITWYYDPAKETIILCAYCYVNGERIMINFCEATLNIQYVGRIVIESDHYRFIVFDKAHMIGVGATAVAKQHNRKLGYKLGLFFGGTHPAPHDVTIDINKH